MGKKNTEQQEETIAEHLMKSLQAYGLEREVNGATTMIYIVEDYMHTCKGAQTKKEYRNLVKELKKRRAGMAKR